MPPQLHQFSNLISPTNNETVWSALSHPNVKYFIDNSTAVNSRVKSAINRNQRADQIALALNEFMVQSVVGESINLAKDPKRQSRLNQKTIGSSLAAKDLMSTQTSQPLHFQHAVLSTNRHGVTHRQDMDFNGRPLSGNNLRSPLLQPSSGLKSGSSNPQHLRKNIDASNISHHERKQGAISQLQSPESASFLQNQHSPEIVKSPGKK